MQSAEWVRNMFFFCKVRVAETNWFDYFASTFQTGQFKGLQMDSVRLLTPVCPMENLHVSPWVHRPGLKSAAIHGRH